MEENAFVWMCCIYTGNSTLSRTTNKIEQRKHDLGGTSEEFATICLACAMHDVTHACNACVHMRFVFVYAYSIS